MTKSTITREQRINEVKELIANAEEWAGYYEHPIHDKPQREMFEGMARVMAEHLAALTAMDSEPVALQPELAKVIYHFRDWNEGFPVERFKADYVISWMLANYPPAQPAPLVPDGYVMVPKEPTEAMMLHNSGCQHHTWDDPDCAMRQTRRLIWSHMLAAAPQEVKGE